MHGFHNGNSQIIQGKLTGYRPANKTQTLRTKLCTPLVSTAHAHYHSRDSGLQQSRSKCALRPHQEQQTLRLPRRRLSEHQATGLYKQSTPAAIVDINKGSVQKSNTLGLCHSICIASSVSHSKYPGLSVQKTIVLSPKFLHVLYKQIL